MHAHNDIEFVPDYCPICNPAGYHGDHCTGLAALTEPEAVTWRGGVRLVCAYECDCCGHRWRRADLWTAAEAGFGLVSGA